MDTRSRLLGADGNPIFASANGQSDYSGLGVDASEGFALPHEWSFVGLFQSSLRMYYSKFDEALKHNRVNSLAMRRDAFIMGKLQERYLPIAGMDWYVDQEDEQKSEDIHTPEMGWYLEPDDPEDRKQLTRAKEVTKVLKTIPRWEDLIWAACEAIWYGRYGVQLNWGVKKVAGEQRFLPIAHVPTNGDKIQFDYDGNPAILIYGPARDDLLKRGAKIVQTDQARALVLDTPEWRRKWIIHRHIINDADYFEPELAGGIQGVGVRHWVYWFWWMRAELLQWANSFLERLGTGMLVYFFEQGNPKSKAAAVKAAKQQSRRSVQVWPRPAGSDTGEWIKFIEPNASGVDAIKGMIADYYEAAITNVIVGQTLSSKAEATGMGSGVAELHGDTKSKINVFDARKVASTLTEDLVKPVHAINWPEDDFSLNMVVRKKKEQRPEKEQYLDLSKRREDRAEIKFNRDMAGAGAKKPQAYEDLGRWLGEPG